MHRLPNPFGFATRYAVKFRLALVLVVLIKADVSHAYVLENIVWAYPNPAIYVNFTASQGALGSRLPSFPLYDGSGSFDQVFFNAVGSWNSYLLNLQIQPVEGSNTNGVNTSNNVNETGFAAAIGGDVLGGETLAIPKSTTTPAIRTHLRQRILFSTVPVLIGIPIGDLCLQPS